MLTREHFKSDEEYYFSCWVTECINNGIIEECEYQPESFQLSEAQTYNAIHKLKTKTNIVTMELIKEHLYTCDALIKFTPKLNNILYKNRLIEVDKTIKTQFLSEGNECFIEVKPSFDQNNMERLFRINQKWVLKEYDVFVNLIHPYELFDKTFYPERYMLNDSGSGYRCKRINGKNIPIKDLPNIKLINKYEREIFNKI